MKSMTNSVSLWFSIAMLTYMPCAVCSSIWSWICTCGGVAGVLAGQPALSPLGGWGGSGFRPGAQLVLARRIFLCGLSVGGLLSIGLAARSWTREGLPDFSAIALLATAIDFKGTTWLFAHVIGRLPALPLILGKGARDIRGEPDQREKIDASYTAIPMRWGAELRLLSEEAQKLAPRVHAPALLLHGALDRTVAASGSRRLAPTSGPRPGRRAARPGPSPRSSPPSCRPPASRTSARPRCSGTAIPGGRSTTRSSGRTGGLRTCATS